MLRGSRTKIVTAVPSTGERREQSSFVAADEIQVSSYKMLGSLFTLGTDGSLTGDNLFLFVKAKRMKMSFEIDILYVDVKLLPGNI